MKNALFFLIFCLFVGTAAAQADKQDRIKSAKIGMITNRLNLTVEQSTGFWSLYNEYEAKHREIRQGIRRLLGVSSSMASGDDKILAANREILALKQKDLDLEKEYMPRFLKIINIRQYAELQKTERDFNQLLINKLKQQGKEQD